MPRKVLVNILVLLILSSTIPPSFAQPNWMARNSAILGKKRLNEIAIPGAHDAGTYAIEAVKRTDILFGRGSGVSSPDNKLAKQLLSMSGLFSKWAKTQERTTSEMLNDGIRYLDIRVCVDDRGRLMTCHGMYGAPVELILDDVKSFVRKNPREIVLLGFNHFWDRQYQIEMNKDQGEIEGLTTANWSKLSELLKTKLGSELIDGKRFTPSSRLSEIWNARGGRQVIALFDTADAPDDDLFWKQMEENTWVEGWEINSFKNGTVKILENAKENQYLNKFFAIRSSVTPDDNGKLITLGLLSADYPSSAEELADTTNPVVFDWIRRDWDGKYPINLIWADFYNRNGLVDLAKHVNGIRSPAKGVSKQNEIKWSQWKEPDGGGFRLLVN